MPRDGDIGDHKPEREGSRIAGLILFAGACIAGFACGVMTAWAMQLITE